MISVPSILVDNSDKYSNYMHTTIYLPHFSYMIRCGIHHPQGGLLVLPLKTIFFKDCYL
jgi:hypothetical protein